MSRTLIATYRLQFREGTDFETARALAPYLQTLGVSHLYASPIFSASPGSTHGYDVVDYNRFEADLGGDDGFLRMSDALSGRDIGLLLDFVPNHMGVSPENAWWEDVLAWGRDSRHAHTFDIAWDAEKVLIPVLGKPYGEAAASGDLSVVLDRERARLRFDAAGYELPLDPRTLGAIFGFLDHPERDRLIRRFAVATPVEAEELTERLREHLAEESFATALDAAIAAMNADKAALHDLHEAQVWRLAWWRTAREKLTYRRFFEIADLIGVRQELRHVFRDSHRTIIRLARERRLDGIRIDHVDGLADPKAYLEDLRQAFQSVRREPMIHVEKILTGEERLRTSWKIEGTTGYEFITALAGLYVDAGQEAAMTAAYAGFLGQEEDLRAMILSQKRSIFSRNLAGELAYLTGEALGVAGRGLATRDLGQDTISRSIVEVAAALPVYRTYVGVEGVPAKDAAIIDAAVDLAKSRREVEADEPIDFIGRLLKLDFEDGRDVAGALNFTRRFQQTTGAVMAKAVEDTVFYRYNRLIALNEVGGEPDHYGAPVSSFHAAMEIRVEDQPEGLLATSTHDTKRGEDARARLYSLSEAPDRWAEIVKGLAERMAPFRIEVAPGVVSPDPASEWMFYQGLLGVLPADFDPSDAEARKAIGQRLAGFMEKAVREAKRYTSWTAPAEAYETALQDFVAAALDAGKTGSFLADFWAEAQPFVAAGALTSLSQTLIKMAAPGVPDIYQGTEFYDLSLVDPDNRRSIDFPAREETMSNGHSMTGALEHWRNGHVKAKLTAAGLKVRASAPELFTKGAYVPLEVEGEKAAHVVAFARTDGEGRAAIAIAPRLCLSLLGSGAGFLPSEGGWGDTRVILPRKLSGLTYDDGLEGGTVKIGSAIEMAGLPNDLPFALLIST
ncbi:alpha-amylase [Aureimonas sp. Leaf454]|uniref:malto-oligosyltrehalose synthase n=1 Tax=Aureimonas sp. Leaf454 TaxID=1736381 RepID=UPI0006FD722B|nr:malto-oligosyltrehalose synthase [Aureimonas sp. Leaf454]KQT47453.1 alpha-amylase [Aureimonas sp. Leaf454]